MSLRVKFLDSVEQIAEWCVAGLVAALAIELSEVNSWIVTFLLMLPFLAAFAVVHMLLIEISSHYKEKARSEDVTAS